MAGRPKIEIDRDTFEKLCRLQCTREEIASFMDCSEDTIERWCKREYGANFAVIFHEKREGGKVSLRRYQWELAKKNPTMAIWLGKQYLGQRDKSETEVKIAKSKDEVIEEMEAFFHDEGPSASTD